MQIIAIKLNEDLIRKEGILDLDKANKIIEDAFLEEGCTVFKEEKGIKYWTRQIDDKDFSKLWEIQLAFRELDWFMDNILVWDSIEMRKDGSVAEYSSIKAKWLKGKGKLYFAVEMDENKIRANGYKVSSVYECIEDAFAGLQGRLDFISNNVRFYTRDLYDGNDFQRLWRVALGLKDLDWFKASLKGFEYIEVDADGKANYAEDLIADKRIL